MSSELSGGRPEVLELVSEEISGTPGVGGAGVDTVEGVILSLVESNVGGAMVLVDVSPVAAVLEIL